MKTISRVFATHAHARGAIDALEAANVLSGEVSLIAHSPVSADHDVEPADSKATVGAGIGGVIGGAAGLLMGLGVLVLPGLGSITGPVVAAGWFSALAAGVAVGAIAGGLVGALVRAGMSHGRAHARAEVVRRGGILVSARVEDFQAERIRTILDGGTPVAPQAPAAPPGPVEIEKPQRDGENAA
jgi:hypothetical protein